MTRWSDFHAPVHSVAFAMDRQFCRRDMDAGVKKDIWSVMEDFSKSPGSFLVQYRFDDEVNDDTHGFTPIQ